MYGKFKLKVVDRNKIVTEQTYPVRPIWLLKAILPGILQLLFFFFIYVFFWSSDPDSFILVILFLFFFSCPMVFMFIKALLMRHNFHYAIGDKYMDLKQGIFSKQNRHLPFGVIQNVILDRGFIDRILGLATLIIENASAGGGVSRHRTRKRAGFGIGFTGNAVMIPGLSYQDAEELKGIILEKVKANPIQELGM